MAKKKQFAVLGLGRFGSNVAISLEQMGYNVLGVEKDETIAAAMADKLTHVLICDIRNSHALEQAGIQNMDAVVIASKNLEASLMAAMICSEMNVPEIIVKAIDERHAEMAKKIGATRIIFSEKSTAKRLALHLVSDNVMDYLDIDGDIKILCLNIPSKYAGKNLIETGWRDKYQVAVIVVENQKETLISPPLTYKFEEGDKIFVIGSLDALSKFETDEFA